MTTNQELRHISVRTATGATSGTYDENWIELFDLAGIPAGTFDERLIGYLQLKLSSSASNLPDLMAAFAQANGVQMWSELGTFDASVGPPAPGKPFIIAADDTGKSNTDGITSNTAPRHQIPIPTEAVVGTTITLYQDVTTSKGTRVVDAGDVTNGFVVITPSVFTDGTYSMTATATYVSPPEESGQSPANVIRIDTQAPSAPTDIIVAPQSQGSGPLQTNEAKPFLRVSLPGNAETNDDVKLNVNATGDTNYTLTATDITNGYADIQTTANLTDAALNPVFANITDVAGNAGPNSATVQVQRGVLATQVPAVVHDGTTNELRWTTASPVTTNTKITVSRTATNTIQIQLGIPSLFTTETALVADGPMAIFWSADPTATQIGIKSASKQQIVAGTGVAGITAQSGVVFLTFGVDDQAMVLHVNEDSPDRMAIGSDEVLGNRFDGEVHGSGCIGSFIDWNANTQENLNYLWNNAPGAGESNIRDPSVNGANWFVDTAPQQCNADHAATYSTNRGTGANANSVSAFTDATSPGNWSPKYEPATGATIERTDSDESSADQTTYTFTGKSLGVAAADRFIAVAITGRSTNGARLLSNVVINSVTAAVASDGTTNAFREQGFGTTRSHSAIYIAAVPTGATGDIVVTWDGQNAACSVEVYRMTGIVSATCTDVAENGTGTASNELFVNCTVNDGGIAIGVCSVASGGQTNTWTNITEDIDKEMVGGGECRSTAFELYATGGSPVDTRYQWTGGSNTGGVVASWPPA